MNKYKKKMPIEDALEILQIEVEQLYPYIHEHLIDAIETLLADYYELKDYTEEMTDTYNALLDRALKALKLVEENLDDENKTD